jgi:hypothetical protein
MTLGSRAILARQFLPAQARIGRTARDDLSSKPDALNEGLSRARAANSARRNPA